MHSSQQGLMRFTPEYLEVLSEAIAELLVIIFKNSQRREEVPEDKRRANTVYYILKREKRRTRELQTCQSNLSPWKIQEQIIKQSILK